MWPEPRGLAGAGCFGVRSATRTGMLLRAARRTGYRIAQKLAVVEGVRLLSAPTAWIEASRTNRVRVVPLDAETLRRQAALGHAQGCDEYTGRLGEPDLDAFGVLVEERLACFAWFRRRGVEGPMNRGYHPGTATAIELVDDAAFVFHAYTAPEFRGRGLLPAVLASAARTLRRERGVRWLATTTECVNDAARRALCRAGFEDHGGYWRVGVGRRVAGWYPPPTMPFVGFA